MDYWLSILLGISWLVSVLSFLPAFDIQHWTFRIMDFIRLQVLGILIILLILLSIFSGTHFILETSTKIGLFAAIVYQLKVVLPYFPIGRKQNPKSSNAISLLSVNVLQKNTDYYRLIQRIRKVNPDIILTLESNKSWENALSEIERDYAFSHKAAKENRYGLHFYTRLEVKNCTGHELISAEHPSVEIELRDDQGNDFLFWGVHPPPPSPTEKPTSKQKDAELMAVAKRIRSSQLPVIVSGDFNNVCWSRSSKLFTKITDLIDARIGRGFHGSFPVRPRIFRFPIDLLFHSESIKIHSIKTLEDIGSDHLPLYSIFSVPKNEDAAKSKPISKETKEIVQDMIREGKKVAPEENID